MKTLKEEQPQGGFYNQEREEINDSMYCHWQSVSEEMFEAACERMDYLQSNMPDEV